MAQTQSVGLKPKIVTGDFAAVIDDVFSDTGTGAMYHLSWATSGDPDAACSARQPRLRGNLARTKDPGHNKNPQYGEDPTKPSHPCYKSGTCTSSSRFRTESCTQFGE